MHVAECHFPVPPPPCHHLIKHVKFGKLMECRSSAHTIALQFPLCVYWLLSIQYSTGYSCLVTTHFLRGPLCFRGSLCFRMHTDCVCVCVCTQVNVNLAKSDLIQVMAPQPNDIPTWGVWGLVLPHRSKVLYQHIPCLLVSLLVLLQC